MTTIQLDIRQELIDSLTDRQVALDAWTEYCAEVSEALSIAGSALSVGTSGDSSERAVYAAYGSRALGRDVILSWDIYQPCATCEELASLLLKYHNEGRLLDYKLQKP